MPLNELVSNSKCFVTSTINLNNEIIQVLSIDNLINATSLEITSPETMIMSI